MARAKKYIQIRSSEVPPDIEFKPVRERNVHVDIALSSTGQYKRVVNKLMPRRPALFFRLVALACTLALPSVSRAQGNGKPSVCEDFRVFQDTRDDKRIVGICYDSKKPVPWTSWYLVELTEPSTGAKRRYAVGFR